MFGNTLIIAEAGVNHNGTVENAIKLVDLALMAKADIVKFQIFQSNQLVTKAAPKAKYQMSGAQDAAMQIGMLKELELSFESHKLVADYCKKLGLEYMSTAFDLDSLSFLVNELGVSSFKLSSGDLTNAPFLLAHASYRRKLIVSTGMSTLGEIEDALGVLAFGLLGSDEKPSIDAFNDAYISDDGQAVLKEYVTLLHCTTEYPTAATEINLNAMQTMSQAFGLDVGFSDHSVGNTASTIAVAFGAKIIEKHFTLDKNMEGPDHQASMAPDELISFVSCVREAEACLGNGLKVPASSELPNIAIARRSLVATTDICVGDVLSDVNVGIKRPGSGISPFEYWNMLGKVSDRSYSEGELLE